MDALLKHIKKAVTLTVKKYLFFYKIFITFAKCKNDLIKLKLWSVEILKNEPILVLIGR